MPFSKKFIIFITSIVTFIGIDWYTKIWAKKQLFYIKSKSYLDGIFTLDYAENNGAALSFGSQLPENQAFLVLQILPLIILIILFVFILKNLKQFNGLAIVAYTAIFSGGMANLIDRFLNKRHVVDFMIIEWGWFKTGIFNFADVFISFGIVALIALSFTKSEN